MGSDISSVLKVNYEDIQDLCKSSGSGTHAYLISTLPPTMQTCLIKGTLKIEDEISTINAMLSHANEKDRDIILYGKNSNDDTLYKKYQQLTGLGFKSVKVYFGGMFEWLLLQDVYGSDSFPTTSKEIDILKFKPLRNKNALRV
jgi:hypothetical protein